MTTHHRVTAGTIALVLAAGAAPAAARPFDLNANGSYVAAGSASMQATTPPANPGPCSEVCSGGGYDQGPSRQAATPTSTQQRSTIANTGPCSEVCSGGGYGSRPSRPPATTTSTGPGSDVSSTNGYDFARVPPTVVRISSGDNGFDWGDAGIGAGAALGLVLAATGGTLLLAHRRTQSRTAS